MSKKTRDKKSNFNKEFLRLCGQIEEEIDGIEKMVNATTNDLEACRIDWKRASQCHIPHNHTVLIPPLFEGQWQDTGTGSIDPGWRWGRDSIPKW